MTTQGHRRSSLMLRIKRSDLLGSYFLLVMCSNFISNFNHFR